MNKVNSQDIYMSYSGGSPQKSVAHFLPIYKILLLAAARLLARRKQGRAKIGICTKVLREINTSWGKKYYLENPHSTTVHKIKNSPVTLGLGKAQKFAVFLEISHPAKYGCS